jgi:5'-methylthioadenosine phosphorylase
MMGIIGGSGFGDLPGLEAPRSERVTTPYGEPSCALGFGTIRGREVVFLARHGPGHTIAPHEVNYRANLWALHARGVREVLAIATVGGIRADLHPGTLAIPDQIIDYTWGRPSTFAAGNASPVNHVDFTHPYCERLRQRLFVAAQRAGETVVAGGTYGATQGPRLETAAEITRMERDGADMVGMTGMPEAALARELGLCYAALAVVVNHAAGRGASAGGIRHDAMAEVLQRASPRVRGIIDRLVETDGG